MSPETAGPTTHVVVDGAHVVVRYRAAADDLTALGYALGVIPNRRVFVFDADGQPSAAQRSDAEHFAGAPAFEDYLRDHVRVEQDEQVCPGAVDPTQDLVAIGVTVRFTCPHQADRFDLSITMLTDLHPAYRTVAVGDHGLGPGRTIYTRDRATVTWSTSPTDPTRPRLGIVVPVLGIVAVAAVGGWAGLRRRRSAR